MQEETRKEQEHIVVFEYTQAAGGHAGIRTWTVFESKAAFDAKIAQRGRVEEGVKFLGEEKIIAEGVTEAEALKLIRQTPLRSYVAAAMDESTDPKTGQVNLELLRSRMLEVGLAVGLLHRQAL